MKKISLLRVAATFVCLLLLTSLLAADGNETLGPPPDTFPLAGGSHIAVGGTGLAIQPGNIEVAIPAGAIVRQVILYWAGEGEDDTITVSGPSVTDTSVTGALIGTVLNAGFPRHSYRADITALGLVTAGGTSTLTVKDADFGDQSLGFEPDGAGVMVFYDDAGQSVSDVQLRDGADFAYTGIVAADPLLCCTVKQTYEFAPRSFDRTASLFAFFGSVEGILSAGGQRPNAITIEVSNGTNTISDQILNPLSSNAGDEWDVFQRQVNVPAGYNSVSMQAFSIEQPPPAGGPASLMWVTAALSVPSACLGKIGDFVWEDRNSNGVQDAGEPGIAGVTLTLTLPDASTRTTVTDGSGKYLFSGLCAGSYSVAVTGGVPAGLTPTTSFQGNPASDSNASPANVTLTADDSEDLTIDFGYVSPPACNLLVTKTATPDLIPSSKMVCEKDPKHHYSTYSLSIETTYKTGGEVCKPVYGTSSGVYVTYNYTVTNLGGNVVNLIGLDSHLGWVFPPQSLASGQTIQATRYAWITSQTTNTITVSSTLAGTNTSCTAQASATVKAVDSKYDTYTPPPPPPPGGGTGTFDAQEIKAP